jgi:ketosteroid isomerase-like protein
MRRVRNLFPLLLVGMAPIIALGDAAPGSPEQIVAHHLSAAASGDVAGLVADYADAAVVITPGGKTQGIAALRKMFEGIFGGAPGSQAPLVVQQQFFTKEIGYIAWVQNAGKPEEVRGSDTFIVRKGKIVAQTVALVPMHAPAH